MRATGALRVRVRVDGVPSEGLLALAEARTTSADVQPSNNVAFRRVAGAAAQPAASGNPIYLPLLVR